MNEFECTPLQITKLAGMNWLSDGKVVINTKQDKRQSPFQQTLYHWRQPRRGCRGHIPQYFGWGDVNGNIPLILLRTFGYSRPILVALRSLSLKPFSFGYKMPPIRFSQAGGQSAHKARPPNLQLALTPLKIHNFFQAVWCHDVFRLYGRLGRAAEREWTERNATDWRTPCRKFLATPLLVI